MNPVQAATTVGIALPSIIAAAHAIMYKRDSRSSGLWVLLSILLPLVGPWLYWVLGINRLERKTARQLGRRERPFDSCPWPGASRDVSVVDAQVAHLTPLRDVADRVTRLPLLPGNAVLPLHNGDRAYPVMLETIRQATRTVTLASYIFDADDVGLQFADALCEAAGRGVQVRLLVDGIGALGSLSRMSRRLTRAGLRVGAFFPLRFPFGRLRINLRNHRKILVVDGNVGFTGGMNISKRHLLDRPRDGQVEDLHFRIEGPVVGELQHTFAEDWALATGEILEGEAYFPMLSPVGTSVCRGISSGPDETLGTIHWILLAALTSAQNTVYMVTPYFVPTSALVTGMVMAALRGVTVKLFLPSKVDIPFMRWVADAYLWQLLEHGIHVYRRKPPFIHTKLVLVDDRWAFFGSANLDPRSFRLNFEFNVEAYDPVLASNLSRWLDGLVPECHRVTLEEVDSRPMHVRLRDGCFKLFSPHL